MIVSLGLPIYDHPKAEMMISLVRALLQFPHELHLSVQRGCYIADARERCVHAALEVNADYLVFIDSDIVFPADGITRLLEHQKDIIGANYREKRLPPTSTVKLPDGLGGFLAGEYTLPDRIFKPAAVATGFMAINLRRLTERMTAPYFAFSEDAAKVTYRWASGPGEDTAFCLRARAADLEVWCDPTIELGHVGEYIY